MKLFVATLAFFLFAWSASAEPLPSECRWGASYWCRSQAAARRCGQVDYCRTNVWRKATTTISDARVSSSSAGCEACSVITELARKIMNNAKTEAEAKTMVEKACDIMSGQARTECSSIINNYFDLVWKLVEQEMADDAICKQIGFCSSTLIVQQNYVSASPCDICKLVVSFLKPYVDSSSTEAEVKAAVEGVCSILPGNFSSECSSLVDSYFDLIWNLLKSEIDSDQICNQIGLCNTTMSMKTFAPVHQNHVSEDMCDLCKTIVNFLKPFVDSGSTESEVETALEKFCALLPSDLSSTCNSTVKDYFDLIWTLVKAEIDSGDICVRIGLCNSTVSVIKSVSKPAPVQSGVECALCKYLVGKVEPYVTANTTETEVEKLLDDICNSVFSPIRSECTNLVAKFVPDILQYLEQKLDPTTICTLIELCSNNTRPVLLASSKQLKAPQGFMCNTCKKLTGELISALMSDSIETKVEDKLTGICGKFTSKVDSSECQSLLKTFFPIVWKFIKSEVDSNTLEQEACSLIKLCDAPTKTLSVMAPQGPIKCAVCKLIAHELEKLVGKNSTKSEIETALGKVCSLVPAKFQDKCKSFIRGEGDQLLSMILKDGPSIICDVLCLLKTEETAALAMPKNTITCDACTEVLELVKNFLTSDQAEAVSLIMDVCDIMPSSVKPECDDFVKSYGPDVVEIIANYIDPHAMCQLFCTARRFKLISLRAGRNQI